MPKALTPDAPLTLAHLSTVGKWVRYSLIPFLAILVGAGIWAHDTNAAVTRLETRQPVIDRTLHDLDTRTKVIDAKLDLLLEGRVNGPAE